jgi:hypothetical protein
MKRFIRWPAAVSLAAASALYLAGCSESPSAPAAKPTNAVGEAEHGHKPGAHGGIIVEIGRDNFHAEAIFERAGTLRLYILGKDETRVQEVELQELTAYAKAQGGSESSPFALKAQPQPGDADGKTSLFVGELPRELRGRPVEVTIPGIRVAGERFRLSFASSTPRHDAAVPAAVAGDKARKLYLTPGGLYTDADIEANGATTAAEKYKGVLSNHDMEPAAGDQICPVTATKADRQFTWVVGGRTYEFCCPPCIDEFVKLAKEQPAKVKSPQEYVK